MKEYICKDDLKGLNQYAFGVEELINYIPTVTKADICREFFQKALFKYSNCHGFLEDCLLQVLEEMEQ